MQKIVDGGRGSLSLSLSLARLSRSLSLSLSLWCTSACTRQSLSLASSLSPARLSSTHLVSLLANPQASSRRAPRLQN